MTILPRAATAPELAKLRSENQSSRLYLTVQVPAQVYVARVVSTPTSTDNVASIAYNSGSGTYTNILADMTMYVSATGYGNYDKGMVRVRNTTGLGATSGSISVFTSEINWAANDYLTIVDAFDLWPRTPYGDAMDYDIVYSDQHSKCASIPVLGGRYKVKWIPAGGTVSVYPDASSSWALNNTITGVQWAAPGASATSGMTTNTPTFTYNAANFDAGYRTSLTLTNSDSVTSVGYGRVFVLASENDAITQFRVDSIQGSYQSGGWSAQITMYGQADLTVVRDRALCIIHRRDWYGDTEGSIGYVADDENIEMVGWIAGDTIKWSPLWSGAGTVTFTIQGPQYWLNKLTMPAVGLKNISSHAPTNWKRFTGLTAKSATWHVLYWRTTAPACIDCFPIDNAWGALQLQGSGAQTVWNQLSTILNDFLIAKPCCDAYGRLHMQIEQNCLPTATRSSIPTVMTITTQDWWNAIDFERREVQDVAAVDLSGDIYNGTTSTPTYSLSPGRTFGARGSSVFVRDRLVLYDQTTANALAGAVYGWQNNPYPKWRFQLASNMHLIDLAPYQYLSVDVAPADTRRGFAATGLRLIPRTITRTFQNGVMLSEVDVEAESSIGLGITGDTPPAPPAGSGTGTPPPTPPPDPVPLPSGNAKEVWFATDSNIFWSGDYFAGGQPTWSKVAVLPPGITAIIDFRIAYDGSTAYIRGDAGGVSSIWASTNPKAVSPTWSAIATTGDTIGGFVVNVTDYISMNGTTLITSLYRGATSQRYYAEYSGSWSLQLAIRGYGEQFVYGYEVAFSSAALDQYQLYRIPLALLYTWSGSFGGGWSRAWRNHIGGPVWIVVASATAGSDIRNATGNSVALNLPTGSGASGYTVTGALRGVQVYVTRLGDGALYLSDDGTTFTNVGGTTWAKGWVLDATLTGGGSLVWILEAIPSSNVPTRLYNRNGSVLRDMTGNLWSLVSGNQTVVGAGLTY